SWSNPEWFDGWAEIAETATAEEQRPIINRMLEVFYNDPPWLMLYFQPDFYGVSNRIDWEARRDERVYLWDAALANWSGCMTARKRGRAGNGAAPAFGGA